MATSTKSAATKTMVTAGEAAATATYSITAHAKHCIVPHFISEGTMQSLSRDEPFKVKPPSIP